MTYCGIGGEENTSVNGTGCIVDARYDGDDIAPLTIDVGLKILVAIGTLAVVLGLVLVYKFFTGKKVKL